MDSQDPSTFLSPLIGQVVVVDFRASYVCIGTLVAYDRDFLEVRDADLHDFRDSPATREVYVFESKRLGVRRNRRRVLLNRDDVLAIGPFSDVAES